MKTQPLTETFPNLTFEAKTDDIAGGTSILCPLPSTVNLYHLSLSSKTTFRRRYIQTPLLENKGHSLQHSSMDTYGEHLFYCERIPNRIWLNDEHVKQLTRDLAKSARHPVVEQRPVERLREKPDIRVHGRSGRKKFVDVMTSHLLRQARIRNVSKNPMHPLNWPWTAKISGYSCMLQATKTRFIRLPFSFPTLTGRHQDAHRSLCAVATTTAARGLSKFSQASSILLRRHAYLLVTNNALCLISGLLCDI